jgi:hypothetical protein
MQSSNASSTHLCLVGVHDVSVKVSLEAVLPPLAANTRLLVATKEGLWCWLLEGVDEDGSSFQTLADSLSTGDVLAPHASTETSLAGISALDDLLLVVPWLGWDDGAEWLLLDDHAVVWRVVDDGWLDEEALSRGDIGLANGELVALALWSVLASIHAGRL